MTAKNGHGKQLLAVGVPISYAIGFSALAVILRTIPLDVAVITGAQRTFVGMSKFSLTDIPFFILAGNLMNQGGIAKRLVDFVMALLGKFPGAMLVTTLRAIPALSLIVIVIGGIIQGVFTATEGSAIAVLYALLLGVCYRNITLRSFWKIVVDSARSAA